jgi:hypothetical protein
MVISADRGIILLLIMHFIFVRVFRIFAGGHCGRRQAQRGRPVNQREA